MPENRNKETNMASRKRSRAEEKEREGWEAARRMAPIGPGTGPSSGGRGGEEVTTREPVVGNRDPVRPYVFRHYIPAPMPIVCPACGHSTRQDSGRHVDPANKKIREYRVCCKCGKKLTAGRDMTAREVEALCTHADGVREYQDAEIAGK